jgi:hypothetical protein
MDESRQKQLASWRGSPAEFFGLLPTFVRLQWCWLAVWPLFLLMSLRIRSAPLVVLYSPPFEPFRHACRADHLTSDCNLVAHETYRQPNHTQNQRLLILSVPWLDRSRHNSHQSLSFLSGSHFGEPGIKAAIIANIFQ